MRIFLPLLMLAMAAGPAVFAGEPATVHDFAHIGDGGPIRTVFLLVNQGTAEANAEIRFFADDGSDLSVTIDGTTSARHMVVLPAGAVRRLATSRDGDVPRTGWAQLTASQDIGAQVLFEIFSAGGDLITQAAVEAPGVLDVGDLFVNFAQGTNTGVALVNLSSAGPVRIQLTLKDEDGAQLAQGEVTLQALEHQARFVNQFFPEIGFTSGRLCVNASGPISVITLQQTGLVLGTLPFVKRVF